MSVSVRTVPAPAKRLTGTQRKHLRGVAHPLQPLVHVGRAGLTDAVLDAIDRALEDHELVKVKIAADREERVASAAGIEAGCGAEVVGLVGRIAIVYREQSDPARRRIVVPKAKDAEADASPGGEASAS